METHGFIVATPFPCMALRQLAVDTKVVELSPIENAIELVQKRCAMARMDSCVYLSTHALEG